MRGDIHHQHMPVLKPMPLELLPGQGYPPGQPGQFRLQEIRQRLAVRMPWMKAAPVHDEQLCIEFGREAHEEALHVVFGCSGSAEQVVDPGGLSQAPRFLQQGRFSHRSRDGDERQRVGHVDQRQRQPLTSGQELRQQLRRVHLLSDGQGAGARIHQRLGERNLPGSIGRDGEAVGHHQLAAGDPFPQPRQVRRVGPRDPVATACGSGQQRESQLGFRHELGHCNRH